MNIKPPSFYSKRKINTSVTFPIFIVDESMRNHFSSKWKVASR